MCPATPRRRGLSSAQRQRGVSALQHTTRSRPHATHVAAWGCAASSTPRKQGAHVGIAAHCAAHAVRGAKLINECAASCASKISAPPNAASRTTTQHDAPFSAAPLRVPARLRPCVAPPPRDERNGTPPLVAAACTARNAAPRTPHGAPPLRATPVRHEGCNTTRRVTQRSGVARRQRRESTAAPSS